MYFAFSYLPKVTLLHFLRGSSELFTTIYFIFGILKSSPAGHVPTIIGLDAVSRTSKVPATRTTRPMIHVVVGHHTRTRRHRVHPWATATTSCVGHTASDRIAKSMSHAARLMLLAKCTTLQGVQLRHWTDGRVILVREILLRCHRRLSLHVLVLWHHGRVQKLIGCWRTLELSLAGDSILTSTLGCPSISLRTEEPIPTLIEAVLKLGGRSRPASS